MQVQQPVQQPPQVQVPDQQQAQLQELPVQQQGLAFENTLDSLFYLRIDHLPIQNL
jgi:hypothetical protein